MAKKTLLRQAESMWLTDKFVERPWTVVFIGQLVIFLFVVLTVSFESYWPSPITNRDLLDYGDESTLLFDAREAVYSEIQQKSTPTGQIPLQSISKMDWWLFIGIECIKEGCDNVLTPEGLRLMEAVDRTIVDDPLWPKVCLLESGTDNCAFDLKIGGKIAKASPLDIFKFAYGDDLSEITQYGIDIGLFGLAYE